MEITDLKKICRSSVKFQFQASGFLKSLIWVVTVSGKRLAAPPPGLSTLPFDTETIGWKGGLPPIKIESLTPRRVKYRPAPPRMMVLSFRLYAKPTRGWNCFHCTSE